MEHWALLEADFAETYGVLTPMSLNWRKFLLLVKGLRPESRFLQAVWEESPARLRQMLQKQTGNDTAGLPRRTITNPQEFLEGLS